MFCACAEPRRIFTSFSSPGDNSASSVDTWATGSSSLATKSFGSSPRPLTVAFGDSRISWSGQARFLAGEIEDGVGARPAPDKGNVCDSLTLQLFYCVADRIRVDVLDRDHARALAGDSDCLLLPAGRVEGGAVREYDTVVPVAPSQRGGACDGDPLA